MSNERFGRTLLLNSAADKLGLDRPTRRAMTHLELFIGEMVKRDVTWDDVPDKFGVPDLLPGLKGRLLLKVARKEDGFQAFEEAVNDPALRAPLLAAYVSVIEIATPDQTATIASTIKYLQDGQL